MALHGKAMGFVGLDEGWDFAEGTGQHLSPLPPEDKPSRFEPVICVVGSISQLRPEDLASFSTPNLALGSGTDSSIPGDAWFQDLPGTVNDKSTAAALAPDLSPVKSALSTELVSGPVKSALSTELVSGPVKSALSTELVSGPAQSALSTEIMSSPAKSAFSPELVSGVQKQESKFRSLWQRFRAR